MNFHCQIAVGRKMADCTADAPAITGLRRNRQVPVAITSYPATDGDCLTPTLCPCLSGKRVQRRQTRNAVASPACIASPSPPSSLPRHLSRLRLHPCRPVPTNDFATPFGMLTTASARVAKRLQAELAQDRHADMSSILSTLPGPAHLPQTAVATIAAVQPRRRPRAQPPPIRLRRCGSVYTPVTERAGAPSQLPTAPPGHIEVAQLGRRNRMYGRRCILRLPTYRDTIAD